MNEPKIGPKGQITIPAKIRRKLGLQPGDRILFKEAKDAFTLSRQARNSVMDLYGVGQWSGEPVTIEEMNETTSKGWAGLLDIEE